MRFWRRKHEESITFCIPAYNAEGFLTETIQTVHEQNHPHVRTLISIDLSDDRTSQIVHDYCKKDGFEVHVQKKKLGWAGNINFMLSRVRTRYFCILPHDDLLKPNFASRLIEHLQEHPEGVASYSDIQCFGSLNGTIIQRSILGNQRVRVTDFLKNHFNAVAFRAVVDRGRLSRMVYCSSNPYCDFAEDTIWSLQLAIEGEVLRVPEPLYHKRYHHASYHRQWSQWTAEESNEAWQYHCLQCARICRDRKIFDKNEDLRKIIRDRYLQQHTKLWQTGKMEWISPKTLGVLENELNR